MIKQDSIDIQQVLYDFNTTLLAKGYGSQTMMSKFPEFNNDKELLQAAYDYSATLNSGKYKTIDELNSKFPEFFHNSIPSEEIEKPSLDIPKDNVSVYNTPVLLDTQENNRTDEMSRISEVDLQRELSELNGKQQKADSEFKAKVDAANKSTYYMGNASPLVHDNSTDMAVDKILDGLRGDSYAHDEIFNKKEKQRLVALQREDAIRKTASAFSSVKENSRSVSALRKQGEDNKYLDIADELNTKSMKIITAPKNYDSAVGIVNWAEGLGETLNDTDIYTSGITEFVRAGNLASIAKKLNAKEDITESESLALEAYINYGLAQKARVNDLSLGYKIGQATAQSLPFMAEMLVTAGLGSVGKRFLVQTLVNKGKRELAEKVAKYLGGTEIKEVIGKGIGKGVAKKVEYGITKTIGGKIFKEGVETVAQTAAMPHTWVGVKNDKLETILNGDKYDFLDFMRSFTNAVQETFTERTGGKMIESGLSKVLPFEKMWNHRIAGRTVSNDIIQSPLAETSEEYLGAIMDFIRSYNLLYSDKSNSEKRAGADEMFTGEGFAVTAGSVLPMSIFGGVSNSVKIHNTASDFRSAKSDLTNYLKKKGASESDCRNIIKGIESSDNGIDFVNKCNIVYSQLDAQWLQQHPDASLEEAKQHKKELSAIIKNYLSKAINYDESVQDINLRYSKLTDEERAVINDLFSKSLQKQTPSKASVEQKAKSPEPNSANEPKVSIPEGDNVSAVVSIKNTDGSVSVLPIQSFDGFEYNADGAIDLRATAEKHTASITIDGEQMTLKDALSSNLISSESEAMTTKSYYDQQRAAAEQAQQAEAQQRAAAEKAQQAEAAAPQIDEVPIGTNEQVFATTLEDGVVEMGESRDEQGNIVYFKSEGKANDAINKLKKKSFFSNYDFELVPVQVGTRGTGVYAEPVNVYKIAAKARQETPEVVEPEVNKVEPEVNKEEPSSSPVEETSVAYWHGEPVEMVGEAELDGRVYMRVRFGNGKEKLVTKDNLFDSVGVQLYPKEKKQKPVDYLKGIGSREADISGISEQLLSKYGAEIAEEVVRDSYAEAIDKRDNAKGALQRGDARIEAENWKLVGRAMGIELGEDLKERNKNNNFVEKKENDNGIRTTIRANRPTVRSVEEGDGARNNLLELAKGRIARRSSSPDTENERGIRVEDERQRAYADRERQETDVEAWAKSIGIWHEDATNELESLYGEKIGSGAESYVYRKDKNTVVKARDITGYNSLSEAIQSIEIHNKLFPETAMTITGFGRSDGEFTIILEQKYVEGSRFATKEEIAHYIRERFGGVPDETVLGGNSYRNNEYLIQDLKPENVIVGSNDDLYVIDGDFYPINQKEFSEPITANTPQSDVYEDEVTSLLPKEDADNYRAAVLSSDIETLNGFYIRALNGADKTKSELDAKRAELDEAVDIIDKVLINKDLKKLEKRLINERALYTGLNNKIQEIKKQIHNGEAAVEVAPQTTPSDVRVSEPEATTLSDLQDFGRLTAAHYSEERESRYNRMAAELGEPPLKGESSFKSSYTEEKPEPVKPTTTTYYEPKNAFFPEEKAASSGNSSLSVLDNALDNEDASGVRMAKKSKDNKRSGDRVYVVYDISEGVPRGYEPIDSDCEIAYRDNETAGVFSRVGDKTVLLDTSGKLVTGSLELYTDSEGIALGKSRIRSNAKKLLNADTVQASLDKQLVIGKDAHGNSIRVSISDLLTKDYEIDDEYRDAVKTELMKSVGIINSTLRRNGFDTLLDSDFSTRGKHTNTAVRQNASKRKRNSDIISAIKSSGDIEFSMGNGMLTGANGLSSEEAELDHIKEQAIADGTFMKAPNGKPTNLNEKQWLQVRTKAFKKWFGDWELAAKEVEGKHLLDCSKVVDENGEPMVVYHGTLSKSFTIFNEKKGFNIEAIWHSKDVSVAAHFGGTSQQRRFDNGLLDRLNALSSIEDVVSFAQNELGLKVGVSKNIISKEDAKEFGVESGTFYRSYIEYNGGSSISGIIKYHDKNGVYSELKNAHTEKEAISGLKESLSSYAHASINHGSSGLYNDYISLKNPLIVDAKGSSYHQINFMGQKVNTEYIASYAKQNGYDGVIIRNVMETNYESIKTDDFISFSPSQIKSATDNVGTFDSENPDIRFSSGSDVSDTGMVESEVTRSVIEEASRSGVEVVEVSDEEVSEALQQSGIEPLTDTVNSVYGYAKGGKIYLTKRGLNPNTPLHEYTHLWAKMMQSANKKEWSNIVELLKGSPVWESVVNDKDYANIRTDDNKVASEVLSRLSGTHNSQRLMDEMRSAIESAKERGDIMDAVGRHNVLMRIKEALNKFWQWVGTDLFHIKFNSIEEVTDRVLYDFVSDGGMKLENKGGKASLDKAEDKKALKSLQESKENSNFVVNITQNAGEDGKQNRLQALKALFSRNERDRVNYKNALNTLRKEDISEAERAKAEQTIIEIQASRKAQMETLVGEALKGVDGVKLVEVSEGTGVYIAGTEVVEYTSKVSLDVENGKEKAATAVMAKLAEVLRQDSFIVNYPNEYELDKKNAIGDDYAANVTVVADHTLTPSETAQLANAFLGKGLGVTITGNEITTSNFSDLSDKEFYDTIKQILEDYGNAKTNIQDGGGAERISENSRVEENNGGIRGSWFSGTLGYNKSSYKGAKQNDNGNYLDSNGNETTEGRYYGKYYNSANAEENDSNDVHVQGTSVTLNDLGKRLEDTLVSTERAMSSSEQSDESSSRVGGLEFFISRKGEELDEALSIPNADERLSEAGKLYAELKNAFVQDVVDSNVYLHDLVEELNSVRKDEGAEMIPLSANPYEKASNVMSSAGGKLSIYHSDYYKPMINEVRINIDALYLGSKAPYATFEEAREAIEKYLLVKDFLERRDMGLSVEENVSAWYKEFMEESKGVTPEAFVAKIEECIDSDSLWERWGKLTQYLRDELYNSHLISKERYDEMNRRKYYVPQRTSEEFKDVENYTEHIIEKHKKVRRGIGTVEAIRKSNGTNLEAANPLEWIDFIAQNTFMQSSINEAKVSFLELFNNEHDASVLKSKGISVRSAYVYTDSNKNGIPNIEEIEKYEEYSRYIEDVNNKKHPTEHEEEVRDRAIALRDALGIKGGYVSKGVDSNEVVVAYGNRVFVIDTGNAKLAHSLNHELSREEMSKLLKVCRKLNRLSASVLTTLNPVFAPKNFIRDVKFTIAAAFIEDPMLAARITKNLAHPNLGAISEYLWNGDFLETEDGKMFKQFISDGGSGGYTMSMDGKVDIKKRIDEELRDDMTINSAKNNVLKGLSFLSNSSELIVRYNIYRSALENGETRERALHLSKNLNVNFDIRGSHDSLFSSILFNNVLFANASVRAIVGGYRTLKNGTKSPAAIARLAGVVGFQLFKGYSSVMLMDYYARILSESLLGGDDDDKIAREEYYKTIIDYLAMLNNFDRYSYSNYTKLPLAMFTGNKDSGTLKLIEEQRLAIFSNIGASLAYYSLGYANWGDTSHKLIDDITGAILPFELSTNMESNWELLSPYRVLKAFLGNIDIGNQDEAHYLNAKYNTDELSQGCSRVLFNMFYGEDDKGKRFGDSRRGLELKPEWFKASSNLVLPSFVRNIGYLALAPMAGIQLKVTDIPFVNSLYEEQGKMLERNQYKVVSDFGNKIYKLKSDLAEIDKLDDLGKDNLAYEKMGETYQAIRDYKIALLYAESALDEYKGYDVRRQAIHNQQFMDEFLQGKPKGYAEEQAKFQRSCFFDKLLPSIIRVQDGLKVNDYFDDINPLLK